MVEAASSRPTLAGRTTTLPSRLFRGRVFSSDRLGRKSASLSFVDVCDLATKEDVPSEDASETVCSESETSACMEEEDRPSSENRPLRVGDIIVRSAQDDCGSSRYQERLLRARAARLQACGPAVASREKVTAATAKEEREEREEEEREEEEATREGTEDGEEMMQDDEEESNNVEQDVPRRFVIRFSWRQRSAH